LCTRERAYLGFVAACLGRAHRETANADDAMLFAQQIERLGRLFGEANDTLWSHICSARSVVCRTGAILSERCSTQTRDRARHRTGLHCTFAGSVALKRAFEHALRNR